MEFILVTADEMYLGFDEINEPGSLISCHNFFGYRMNSVLLSTHSQNSIFWFTCSFLGLITE